MKVRIITSIVGIAILFVVLFFYTTILFNIVVAGIALIAIHEIFNAFGFSKKQLYLYIGFFPITFVLMLQGYASSQAMWAVGFLSLVFLAICTIVNIQEVSFANIAGMTLFSIIVLGCFFSVIYLKNTFPREVFGFDAVYLFIMMLGIAWGGDTAAYFAGRALGKHKLCPNVSPKKTWEGAIGGVLGSIIVSMLMTFVYFKVFCPMLPATQDVILKPSFYLLLIPFAGVGSVLGILGDLFASTIKRQHNVKDYGTIFPGHGGILDRFDSVLFIAPFVTLFLARLYPWFLTFS